MTKNEQYELESILFEIDYHGFVIIKIPKLYRLLGKGNKAAGTWRALLDVWEGIDGKREDLHIAEILDNSILITSTKLDPLTDWAGE